MTVILADYFFDAAGSLARQKKARIGVIPCGFVRKHQRVNACLLESSEASANRSFSSEPCAAL